MRQGGEASNTQSDGSAGGGPSWILTAARLPDQGVPNFVNGGDAQTEEAGGMYKHVDWWYCWISCCLRSTSELPDLLLLHTADLPQQPTQLALRDPTFPRHPSTPGHTLHHALCTNDEDRSSSLVPPALSSAGRAGGKTLLEVRKLDASLQRRQSAHLSARSYAQSSFDAGPDIAVAKTFLAEQGDI